MTSPERIWVVGVGAIGSIVAYRLARAGRRPLLVDGWAAHVRVMNESGLRLRGQFGDAAVVVEAVAPECLGDRPGPDLAVVCAKSFQTEGLIARVAPRLAPDGVVLSLQNGMNEETIAAAVGRERTVGGVVVMDGSIVGPGEARQENPEEREFTIGALGGDPTAAVDLAAEALRDVGRVERSRNILGELWSKLVHNCMVNAVSALTGAHVAAALRDPAVWPFVRELAREAVAAARADGVRLGASGLFGLTADDILDPSRAGRFREAALAAYPASEAIHPSMAQDVRKGRPTEIEHLNGWVLRRGERAGLALPANARIVGLIRSLERGELRPSPENRALLVAGIP